MVYRVPGPFPNALRTFACANPRGAPVRLDSPGRTADRVGNFRFAGAVVAYTHFRFGVDSGCYSISAVDVATRRAVGAFSTHACSTDAGIIQFGEVTDLVVSPTGAAAWIVGEGKRLHASNFVVSVSSSADSSVVVDEGPDVVPGSLRLSRSVVTWEKGGQRRSAQL
jgi:hypothetical protein